VKALIFCGLKLINEGISIKLMNIITNFNKYSHQEEVRFTKNTRIQVLLTEKKKKIKKKI